MTKNKKSGFILTTELMLIATVLVIGALVGMHVLQASLNEEMYDLGQAVNELDLGSLLNTNYTSSSNSFTLSFETSDPGELPLTP